ncbi:MAG: class I tRNA ligase family protein, partial [Candidatus Latescibacteria bacterium]|nr:class I tRNA ligase family protein [Candidatus Latescibacterota bacterium]
YLGETFDFHGGGQDLIFPHHENEIAQSEAATGMPFARYWVENGLVLLGGAKMSKSTQHFFLVEDIAKQVEPEVIRFYLQSTHYRSPIEWNEDRLREAGVAYGRLRAALASAERAAGTLAERAGAGARGSGSSAPGADGAGARAEKGSTLGAQAEEAARAFGEAMEDDFNSAKAQGHLFDLAKAINRAAESADASPEDRSALPEAGRTLRRLGETIGLFWGSGPAEPDVPEEVQALVRERDKARVEKQWKRADELRVEIESLGFLLEDQKGGTRARRKS